MTNDNGTGDMIQLTREPGADENGAWFDPAGYPVSPGGKFRATWGWLKQKSIGKN